MIYTYSEITPKMALKWYLFTFSLNTFFAVFFWHVSKIYPFAHHFIYSQCQGFSILNFGAFANIIFKYASSTTRFIGIFIFCMIGSIAGKFLTPVILGSKFITQNEYVFLFILNIMVISIIIGFLYYWEGIAVTYTKIQDEKKKQLQIEQKMIQTQLKLLHTHIEPEFLFNILNYILNLLDSVPEKAKVIQVSLIQYLRMTLAKFNKEIHSVAQEMEMIQAYLDILVLPHKSQLAYNIDIPKSIKNRPVPAMLIHSFVAKIASLVPISDHKKVIALKVDEGPDGLRFELSGSGLKNLFNDRAMNHLETINDRLYNIYGNSGRLILTPRSPEARKIILKFPHKEKQTITDSIMTHGTFDSMDNHLKNNQN